MERPRILGEITLLCGASLDFGSKLRSRVERPRILGKARSRVERRHILALQRGLRGTSSY